jgi:hypothetical protein
MSTALDRLRGITIGDLTHSQLNSVLENLTIDSDSSEQFAIASMIWAAKQAQSSAEGLPFGDLGGIKSTSIPDATPVTLAPVNETWRVMSIAITNDDAENAAVVGVYFTDGGALSGLIEASSVAAEAVVTISLGNVIAGSMELNPQAFLMFTQDGSSSGITVRTTYQVIQKK